MSDRQRIGGESRAAAAARAMLRFARLAMPAATQTTAILPESPRRRRVYDAGLPPLRAPRGVPRRGARGASGLLVPAGAAVRRRRRARSSIVGLAPGMHGANASGPAVHRRLRRHPALRDAARVRLRVARRRRASRDDGLALVGCRITNAVKCLPPGNKPHARRGPRLQRLPRRGPRGAAATAARSWRSGRIAHEAALRALGLTAVARSRSRTARGTRSHGGRALFDSYHCSRYNTNTRRLTAAMFRAVFDAIAAHLGRGARRAHDEGPAPARAAPSTPSRGAAAVRRARAARVAAAPPGRLPDVRRRRRRRSTSARRAT